MSRWKAWFTADWELAVFIHFKLDPRKLAPLVGFELDTWQGDAIVSLVAFTQSRLRPTRGGRFSERLSTPLACHEFLNVRTYIRHGNDRGIYFLSEWIPNRLAALLGPAMYGLPYRVGQLQYRFSRLDCTFRGDVVARGKALRFRGTVNADEPFRIAQPGTLDHFLVERYVAYTDCGGIKRRFQIDHVPWPIAPARVELPETSLLSEFAPNLGSMKLLCGHFSLGVRDVLISGPQRLLHRQISAPESGKIDLCPKPA